MRWSFVIGALVVAGLVIGGWMMFREQQPPEVGSLDLPEQPTAPAPPLESAAPEPEASPPPADPVVTAPAEPAIVLPPLADSDAFVREQLAAITASDASELSSWLAQDDLVRRAAVTLQNAERGDFPRRQLRFIKIRGPFKVAIRGERTFIDEASYRRFDTVTDALTAIPAEQAARQFELYRPLLTEALRELGVGDADVDRSLGRVLELVLTTPVVEAPIEVIRPNVMYEFVDPGLETLQPLQKQLLRAGPVNLTRLQAYARRFAAARAGQ